MKKLLSILLCSIMLFGLSGCAVTRVDYSKVSTSEDYSITLEQQANTTQAIDEITQKASKDVKEVDDETAQKTVSDGLYFIKTNVNELLKDNSTMEKAIYYGTFIYKFVESDCEFDKIDDLEESAKTAYMIGLNTLEYVKYPYRGQEASSNKLETIKEYVAKL